MIFRTSVCRASLVARSPFPSATLHRKSFSASTSLKDLTSPVQSYISTSSDPFLNLSIEHHLLQTSPPDSTILFLYTNRPSIIIGRNQNPWLEVNLALLDATASNNPSNGQPSLPETGLSGTVDLVRRRSGGGTVFHDQGNVNWTVISPSAAFTRDKHAEMVVRALRSNGIARARVNERHDVVLDQGPKQSSHPTDPADTHATPYQTPTTRPLKVSGSAYKLTRARALHHGTCLLNSLNLNVIQHYLHSPAKDFITARGVESVSSPVGNILLENERFEDGVREHFVGLYGEPESGVVEVGEDWMEVEGVRKGVAELKSHEWTYLQTPQFTFSSRGNASSSTTVNKLSSSDQNAPLVEFTARYGVITESNVQLTPSAPSIGESLVGRRLHEISDWSAALPRPDVGAAGSGGEVVGKWEEAVRYLQRVLPGVHNPPNPTTHQSTPPSLPIHRLFPPPQRPQHTPNQIQTARHNQRALPSLLARSLQSSNNIPPKRTTTARKIPLRRSTLLAQNSSRRVQDFLRRHGFHPRHAVDGLEFDCECGVVGAQEGAQQGGQVFAVGGGEEPGYGFGGVGAQG
ncbi:hypothetical protein Q7P37_008777 [Cladosporium fusiforme]